ncbi:hypothetical protein T05_4711 [Trichinella murrelli]|uniref:Uncharacterized protein n=1 Tax=Trichinella murrelli TaxID=144512 RepID=A0A0V0TZK1_9BILA|nr:hypothetical protein T05_4711 [Trichinella murrelli]
MAESSFIRNKKEPHSTLSTLFYETLIANGLRCIWEVCFEMDYKEYYSKFPNALMWNSFHQMLYV